MLNKPELNDWKPVEIEIVNHENIQTKTPNTKERQTRHGDVETYYGYQDFPRSKDRSGELSKKVNEGDNMMIIRFLTCVSTTVPPRISGDSGGTGGLLIVIDNLVIIIIIISAKRDLEGTDDRHHHRHDLYHHHHHHH